MSAAVRDVHSVLLCDDHELVRRGLADLLRTYSDFKVVGEVGTAAEAIAAADRLSPDLVILDVRLPDGSGIEACRSIRERRAEAKVLILTSYPDEDSVIAAVVAGATGYVLKQSTGTDLVATIRAAASGESLLDPRLVEQVFRRIRESQGLGDPRFASLTDQERRVLALLADGPTNREIGEHLGITEKTVKNHVSHILDKLGLHRRTEAAAYMTKRRLLE